MTRKNPQKPVRTEPLKPVRLELTVTENMAADIADFARAEGSSKAEFIRDSISFNIDNLVGREGMPASARIHLGV